MAKTKEERWADVHAEALEQSRCIQSAIQEVRMECLNDRRFVSIPGAMWEGPLAERYANRPKFEINKVKKSLIRIYNDYRNNRITVDFTNKDGSEKDDLASTCDGLFRADYHDSDGEAAVDNAFEEGTSGGYGALRLTTEYEDEYDPDNKKQRIRFEPIFDGDNSVFFVGAKKQDASDARGCFVIYSMSPEDFEATCCEQGWPYDDAASWPKQIDQSYFDWYTQDVVYYAEYYKVEEKTETFAVYKDLAGVEFQYSSKELDDEEFVAEIEAKGILWDRDRKVKRRRIHKYIMSGSKILEDCGYIAGPNIPIIPYYGTRFFVDNVERCEGHVRLAKDASRLKNMQISKLAELASLSAQEKPIIHPEQILGHQELWANDNITNNPYLLLNPIKDQNGNMVQSGPVAYTKVSQIPPVMAGLIQQTEADLRDILGNEGADEIRSNLSGDAIGKIQDRLDMQSFIYISNLAKTMRRIGEVWLGMAREIYTEKGRRMKVISSDKQADSIVLMQPKQDKNGNTVDANNLQYADFEVNVSIGPTSASKKAATRDRLVEMKQYTQDPETVAILDALIMLNTEGEGLEETKPYWRRKLLNVGAVEPTEQERIEMQKAAANIKPDANTVFLEKAAQKEEAQAMKYAAETEKVKAEIDETKADTDKTEAETVEILANIGIKEGFEEAEEVGAPSPMSNDETQGS